MIHCRYFGTPIRGRLDPGSGQYVYAAAIEPVEWGSLEAAMRRIEADADDDPNHHEGEDGWERCDREASQ